MKAVLLRVTGRVQGVGFRYAASAKANDLKVVGWITNAAGGSVHAFVQGDDAAVDAFTDWARVGPAGANVTGFDVSEDVVAEGLTGFEAR